jgi:hypothetical protein
MRVVVAGLAELGAQRIHREGWALGCQRFLQLIERGRV